MARKYDSLINKVSATRTGWAFCHWTTLESRHLRSEAQACFERLEQRLRERGVQFLLGSKINVFNVDRRELVVTRDVTSSLTYGHLFNTTGLQADRVTKSFGVGEHCTLLPFKGIYWQLAPNAPFSFNTNFYPVPDLNVPFLGVRNPESRRDS